jgi:hypothetical protein
VITINALLLEGLKVCMTEGKTKHAIKTTMKGHLLVVLLACPKILYKLTSACYIYIYSMR